MKDTETKLYCLDTNFFIEAWNKYYCPDFCYEYWDIIDELGKSNRIFISRMVKEEIEKTDDQLSQWLKASSIPIRDITEKVQKCLKEIFNFDERHRRLVDDIKGRSIADPWVIAHAIDEMATVVTKEGKNADPTSSRIRIPNVCENMRVRCIDDFKFIKEVGIQFSCKFKSI
ncbi:MAG: DUF4411 family protein [bacterium]